MQVVYARKFRRNSWHYTALNLGDWYAKRVSMTRWFVEDIDSSPSDFNARKRALHDKCHSASSCGAVLALHQQCIDDDLGIQNSTLPSLTHL